MISLVFPPLNARTRPSVQGEHIFDPFRRRWVALTPEEWVRQNMLNYLVVCCGVPPALLAVERQIPVGERQRRFDIVAYNRHMQPWLLVECKALSVPLSSQTLSQVLGYVSALPSTYICVTNGQATYAWQLKDGAALPLEALPIFAP